MHAHTVKIHRHVSYSHISCRRNLCCSPPTAPQSCRYLCLELVISPSIKLRCGSSKTSKCQLSKILPQGGLKTHVKSENSCSCRTASCRSEQNKTKIKEQFKKAKTWWHFKEVLYFNVSFFGQVCFLRYKREREHGKQLYMHQKPAIMAGSLVRKSMGI